MNYGFVIDNRSCIGCHACSTACKSENEVPLGVHRTWVKTTEVGSFPDVRRHFQVTRCNHCANPPCTRICPTEAMYQRNDGIVEFDSDACIGCKACLQACPYDAIHIDPSTGTAAKCHFCAHRTEIGLEPACAVVCPTHAIIAGDVDDPESEIRRVLDREKVSVRRPEKGTAPKVWYVDGHAANLVPTATERTPESFAWSDTMPLDSDRPTPPPAPTGNRAVLGQNGIELRAPQPQGLPDDGPIQVGGNRAGQMMQVGWNAQHQVPWHWPVPAYLLTKGIAAGLFLLLAALYASGLAPYETGTAAVAAVVAVLMMIGTTALLVYDLEQPQRFLYILLRPQWRSWLTRGAVLLIGFSIVATIWAALEAGAAFGWADPAVTEAARPWMFAVGAPFAVGVAIYTAFLFGQAAGRDLWQSPGLAFEMLLHALVAGLAVLLLLATALRSPEPLIGLARSTLLCFVTINMVMHFSHSRIAGATEAAARALHSIKKGRWRHHYRVGVVAVGHVLPLALLFASRHPAADVVAAVAALVGLYLWNHVFVMAPQEVPNS